MHHTTRKRIEFLQAYIKRRARKLYQLDPENITGIRVDRKIVGNQQKPYYSLVFHVKIKRPKGELGKRNSIPLQIKVKFPDGENRLIRTDVRETGEFQFHFNVLDPVVDVQTGETGTAGLFVRDNQNNIFAVTSYHVAARGLLNQKILSYNAANGGPPYPVRVNGINGRLIRGAFTPDMDVAFVFVGQNVPAANVFADGARVDNVHPINGPIPPNVVGRPVILYLNSLQGGRDTRPLRENAHALHTPFMDFVDILFLDNCTIPGDSGSAAFSPTMMILGIVLGGDNNFTYIIPYYKIRRLLDLNPL